MGQKLINPNDSDYLLDFEELIAIAPILKEVLKEEDSFEFSKQLYEFTKIIYEQYKNEKEKLNT
ncbi:MAG: hypothetical protein QE264_06300 [Flavobacterium sp.]|jgi:hypothetical protein|nr:hypothetical protein [Flavobacterium sp.]